MAGKVFGVGFKNKISKSFNRNISSIQAIQWAMKDGNSTKKYISGGLGLAILKEFVTKNKGKIQVVSDDGFYQLNSSGEQTSHFSESFPGTVVNLQFNTNDLTSYCLTEEIKSHDLF